jgi:hypothetical protein
MPTYLSTAASYFFMMPVGLPTGKGLPAAPACLHSPTGFDFIRVLEPAFLELGNLQPLFSFKPFHRINRLAALADLEMKDRPFGRPTHRTYLLVIFHPGIGIHHDVA